MALFMYLIHGAILRRMNLFISFWLYWSYWNTDSTASAVYNEDNVDDDAVMLKTQQKFSRLLLSHRCCMLCIHHTSSFVFSIRFSVGPKFYDPVHDCWHWQLYIGGAVI